MIDPEDLRRLTDWCAARQLTWQPARTEHGEPALLVSRKSGVSWGSTIVVIDDDGFRLMDTHDDILAAGSSLVGLLDALDGGLGTPAMHYTAFASAGLWNSPGSARTYP
jgi:hypothetical protein